MTTLVKNGLVVDGTGREPYRADIFIKNGIITAMGDLGRQRADRIVHASGLYVSPGFIDASITSDHFLNILRFPEQDDFLRNGVTTIIGGMCGSSLAPLLSGGLHSVRKWGNIGGLNIGWTGVEDFFKAIRGMRPGVNFSTFIGHSTLRREISGQIPRDLTESEIEAMETLVQSGMLEGAQGVSTGLEFIHAKNAPHFELLRVLAVAARNGGMHATHLRDYGSGLTKAVHEICDLGEEVGIVTIVSHLQPRRGFEIEFRDALRIIGATQHDRVWFDISPRSEYVEPLYLKLPDWAKRNNFEAMNYIVSDKAKRKKIITELPVLPMSTKIISQEMSNFSRPKTFREFTNARSIIDPREALLELMIATDLRSLLILNDLDDGQIDTALVHPRALVASYGIGHVTGSGISFSNALPMFIARMTKIKAFSLATAIQRITSLPARIFNIRGRGQLIEGYAADIAIFDANNKSINIHVTLVNGEVAFEAGRATGNRNGQMLLRSV